MCMVAGLLHKEWMHALKSQILVVHGTVQCYSEIMHANTYNTQDLWGQSAQPKNLMIDSDVTFKVA